MTSEKSFEMKNPSRISLKILVKEEWLGSGRQSMLKWRVNLGVSSFFPPPGGLHAHIKAVFSICFQKCSRRSQTPFLSIMHLNTSTAGMAPYWSVAGIFVSSIATMVIVPGAAPKIFFLIFSSLPSTDSCKIIWDVVDVSISGAWLTLESWILLPVPEGPVMMTGLSIWVSCLMM